MNKNSKQIIEGLMSIIEEISDKEYQKKVWIIGESESGHDFDETVNWFFDIGQGVFDNYTDYGLTTKQQQLLDEFRNQFEIFISDKENHYHPYQFIDSSEWDEITKKASEVLKAFNYQKCVNSD